MPYIYFCVSFIYASVLASTIMCVSTRAALKQPFLATRSVCDYCQKVLHWWQLIPCIGWFIQLGHCPNCHRWISPFYPITELTVGLLSAWLTASQSTYTPLLVITFNLICLSLACFDAVTLSVSVYPMVLLFIISLIHHQFSATAAIIIVIFYLTTLIIVHYYPIIGEGDLDILAIFSLTFSFQPTLLIIMLASFSALCHFALTKKAQPLPFLPYLVGSAFAVQLLLLAFKSNFNV